MHITTSVRTGILFAILLAVSSALFMFTPTTSAQAEEPTPAGGVIQKQVGKFEEISAGDFGCFSTKDAKGASKTMFDGCLGLLGYYFLKAGAWAAVWVSVGLNFIVAELIVGMGQLVGNMPGITLAWEVFRDLANIFLVGLTVYIGISTIVGASGFASKQLLSRVILAALLVNFSMTLAKVVIDVSNVTAITAYKLILNENKSTNGESVVDEEQCSQPLPDKTEAKTNTCITTGIAGVFWSQLQITKIFNVNDIKKQSEAAGKTGVPDDALFFVGIMGGIMFFVMAFVFGAAAFMLATRFIILLFLLVLSPLAFVFWITGASGQGRVWWHTLLNQSLIAPTLFITWWVAYKVFSDIGKRFNVDENGLAGSAVADVGGIAMATFFFITTGILIASLILTKELGARGAAGAMSMGQRWTRNIAMAPVNLGRNLGRDALRAGGDALRAGGQGIRTRSLSRWANNRAIRRNEQYAEANAQNSDGSYRNNGIQHRVRRSLTNTAYDRARQARLEAAGADARNLDQARAARGRSISDTTDLQQDVEAARTTNRHHGHTNDADIHAWATAQGRTAAQADEYVNTVNDARRRVSSMSQGTQEWMLRNHADVISHAGTASRISSSQMQSLQQNENVSNAQRAPIQRARRTSYENAMGFTPGSTANPNSARTVARNLSETEWKTIGRETIAPLLRGATSVAIVDNIFSTMPESAVQYLPANVFGNMYVQERLTTNHLIALQKADTINTPAERRVISSYILAGHGLAPTQDYLTRSAGRFYWL
jgi:hypothetical protein